MTDKWDKRFDQLEHKLGEKFEYLDQRIECLDRKIDKNHNYLTDMMGQLMKIVGETNRKVSDLYDRQRDHSNVVNKLSKTVEMHKRKIAD